MKNKLTIGITTGDLRGVGPEIVGLALEDPEIKGLADFRIFGPLKSSKNVSDLDCARQALRSLSQATEEALDKRLDAVVTAPVNKARLRLADKNFVGHTEFFAARCGTPVCMMFAAGQWRVSLVTRHLPLREVAVKLNAVEILQTLRLTHAALKKYFHRLNPKIAVAGLNPHAGENGMLGDEETRIILPAIRQAHSEGIQAEGPFAADTLFWRMAEGKWDAAVAMYHDQGLIPIKTLAFKEAVQLTLGLPFLRVSVDHGTAEELVGTGKADPANLKAAIRLAVQLTNTQASVA